MPSRIEGGERLRLAFRVLPRNLRRKINRAAVAGGARVGAKAAREAAPRRTGTLAGSIVTSRDKRSRGRGLVRYLIGPSSRGFYGRFRELGTRFQAARPWLAPAIEEARPDMFRKCGKIWGRGVEREMRKLAGAPRRGR